MRVWAARQLLRRLLGTVVRCRVWTVRCCCLTWCRVMLGMCCVAWLMLVCLVVCPMAMCPAWVVPCGTQLLVVVAAAAVAAAVCRQALAWVAARRPAAVWACQHHRCAVWLAVCLC